MKELKIVVLAIAVACAAGCGGEGKVDAEKAVAVKDGWRRLDPKHYAAMDDVSLLKRWVEIDCTGDIKKGAESRGGIEAMLAKVGGKIDDKGRKCFANLVFLNDALVGMGASHVVVTAVVDKASHEYYLKWKMSVDDVAATLPGVAELYGILVDMKAPPVDIANYLVEEYIGSNAGKRGEVIDGVRQKSEKYRIVKDVLVSSGVSPDEADAGLALFVFKYGPGRGRSRFWDNEKTFDKIDSRDIKAIVPDCRKMRKILSSIKEVEGKNMAEPLINFMATPVDERENALLQMKVYVETFVKNRKEQGDFAAALQARAVAENAVKDQGKRTRSVRSVVGNGAENNKTCSISKESSCGDTPLYLVVDLSGGKNATTYPISYIDSEPKEGWGVEYKTSKIVLRRISPGKFKMGSPDSEVGHKPLETLHEVTISEPFYMGVFPVTQRQYELVTGKRPSFFSNDLYYQTRPVEQTSWNDIRGSSSIYNWPSSSDVGASTFMGMLRKKTGINTFDLPTEAKWEYCCRAGSTTALNDGKSAADNDLLEENMKALGRYAHNFPSGNISYSAESDLSAGTAAVGSYLPNAWGLYDMHGNVFEWCLDWHANYPTGKVENPVGPDSGNYRILRGGSWLRSVANCRSASRNRRIPTPKNTTDLGFRICCNGLGRVVRTTDK